MQNIKITLRLFDGTGDDIQAETQALPSASQGAKSGENTGSDAEGNMSFEQKRAHFRKMIDGDFKDVYAKEFQNAFDKRFKNAKKTEQDLAKTQPIIEALCTKYHCEMGDLDGLQRAIKGEQQENMQPQKERHMYTQLLEWDEQAQNTAREYPDFSIDAQAQNPMFMAMLRVGVPMQEAYEVCNIDAIKQSIAQQTQKAVLSGIRAKGIRPTELGISAQNGAITYADVAKMTSKQRADLAKRAMAGERITL